MARVRRLSRHIVGCEVGIPVGQLRWASVLSVEVIRVDASAQSALEAIRRHGLEVGGGEEGDGRGDLGRGRSKGGRVSSLWSRGAGLGVLAVVVRLLLILLLLLELGRLEIRGMGERVSGVEVLVIVDPAVHRAGTLTGSSMCRKETRLPAMGEGEGEGEGERRATDTHVQRCTVRQSRSGGRGRR